ncbi:MAG: hypothetical protein ACYDCQ_14995 [Dehalococcoidia bacterium]
MTTQQAPPKDKQLAQLREFVVAADYPHATEQFLGLLKQGYRPQQLVGEAISATAPFVQAPSHIMLKADGQSRGVNYDHTILAWRGSTRLAAAMPKQTANLPLAQAMWYTPQGLDVWSQIHCEFPGHYARDQERCGDRDEFKLPSGNQFDQPTARGPKVHFEDHEPILGGSIDERLHQMTNAIMEGERVESYGLFLGLAGEPEARERLKEAVLFAGIIDLQETVIQRGGYQNIGHKALRSRALVDLADQLGWENAHDIFYTVVPDLGCTPRFYELWSMTTVLLPQEFKQNWTQLKRLNTERLSEHEVDEVIDTILWAAPGDVTALITRLLRGGRALLAIADAIIIAYMRYLIDVVEHPSAFFTPGHSFDYCNVVNHWLRRYDYPHQAKALYLDALFVNDLIRANALFPRDPAADIEPLRDYRDWAEALTPDELLVELNVACSRQDPAPAMTLVEAYLHRTSERTNLIATLSQVGATIQNDPHIARLCMSSIEEYACNGTSRKDDILRAWTKYLARAIRRSNDTGCFQLYQREFGF